MDVSKGGVIWMRENPADVAKSAEGDARLVATVKQAAAHAGLKWRETNYLLLRRGPYVLAAGLEELFPMPRLFPFRNTPSSGELVADVLVCR